MAVIPALRRLRQKNIEVQASMDYTVYTVYTYVSSMQDKYFVSIPERSRSQGFSQQQRLPVNRRATRATHRLNIATVCSAKASLHLVLGLRKSYKNKTKQA